MQKKLKHICRVEQEKKKQYGWFVRIMRDGVTHQKFFYDSVHSGKSSALLRAIAYRDELLQRYPKPEHGNLFNRLTKRNNSGYPGVNRTQTRRHGYTYDVWQAGWFLPNGRHVNRKFPFSPNGRSEEEAKKLALKARREGLKMIERMRREPEKKRALRPPGKKPGASTAGKKPAPSACQLKKKSEL